MRLITQKEIKKTIKVDNSIKIPDTFYLVIWTTKDGGVQAEIVDNVSFLDNTHRDWEIQAILEYKKTDANDDPYTYRTYDARKPGDPPTAWGQIYLDILSTDGLEQQ